MAGDASRAGAERAGVEVPPEAERAARELAARVREVAATLPFGADPADFLAALERLAPAEDAPAALP